MTAWTTTGHRGASALVLLVVGGAISVAAWIGGDPGLGIGLAIFYVVAAAIAYVWARGKGDIAAVMRAGGDERQRMLDQRATAVSGLAMSVAAIGGLIVESARGNDVGGYGVIAVVGGISYVVALVVLRLRH